VPARCPLGAGLRAFRSAVPSRHAAHRIAQSVNDQQRKIARRQAKARRLRADGKSVRAIARELRVTGSTVQRDLAAAAPDHTQLAPPPQGNTRRLVHGAHSERALAPCRERHARELRHDFPDLDGRRLALLADRLARIEVASRWLDGQDTIVLDDGRVLDAADRVEKWSSRAEGVLAALHAECAPDPRQAFADYMAERYGDGQ
jgi:transposase